MTEQEKLLQAKIPGQETGIEVKRSFCSICEPLFHCGINAYVKDGKVIKPDTWEDPAPKIRACIDAVIARKGK